MAAGSRAVKRGGRSAAIAAMLKRDSHRYSAHDAKFFEHRAVAAASRNI
jgi:hypothetical protein